MPRIILTLIALSLLISTAQAQLTTIEHYCRMNADHVAAVLTDRARGYSLTDILLAHERQFETRQMEPYWRQHYHGLTRMAYSLSDITPSEGRLLQEAVCIEVHTARAAKKPAPTPRRTTPQALTRDPRRY